MKSGGELAHLADARSSLERARSLSEVKAILDVAVAARKYAEAKRLGEESLAYAQEIINRAVRRMGEMLAADPRIHPGNQDQMYPRVTSDLGITRMQSSRAQQIARIPEPVFAGPDPAASPDVAAQGRAITAAQQRKMHALFREHDMADREAGLMYVATIIGRPVESTKELTVEEAGLVIDALETPVENYSEPTLDVE